MVPDIAAFADASPGYPVVCSKGVQSCTGSGQSIAYVGGTSAAAPLVVGMIALWSQQARNQGLPRPGFVAPLLTTLAQHQPSAVHRHHRGHQRALRRLLLPGPTRIRPGHRLGLADSRRGRVVPAALIDRSPDLDDARPAPPLCNGSVPRPVEARHEGTTRLTTVPGLDEGSFGESIESRRS